MRAGFNWNRLNIQPGDSYQAALGDIYYPNNPNRGNCAGQPLNPDGSCTFTGVLAAWTDPLSGTTQINRYTGVLGAWYRKGALHADVNAEYGAADNWIYRTDPELPQLPRQYLVCSASVADAGRQFQLSEVKQQPLVSTLASTITRRC